MTEVAFFDIVDKEFFVPLHSISNLTDFVLLPIVITGFLGELLIVFTLLRQGYQYLSVSIYHVFY